MTPDESVQIISAALIAIHDQARRGEYVQEQETEADRRLMRCVGYRDQYLFGEISFEEWQSAAAIIVRADMARRAAFLQMLNGDFSSDHVLAFLRDPVAYRATPEGESHLRGALPFLRDPRNRTRCLKWVSRRLDFDLEYLIGPEMLLVPRRVAAAIRYAQKNETHDSPRKG